MEQNSIRRQLNVDIDLHKLGINCCIGNGGDEHMDRLFLFLYQGKAEGYPCYGCTPAAHFAEEVLGNDGFRGMLQAVGAPSCDG